MRRVLISLAAALALAIAVVVPAAAKSQIGGHDSANGGDFSGEATVPIGPMNPGDPNKPGDPSGPGGPNRPGGPSGPGGGGRQDPPPAVFVVPPGQTNPCLGRAAGPCGFIGGSARPAPKPSQPGPGRPVAPGVSPGQAYARVFAELEFVAPMPGVGPDHAANRLFSTATGLPIDSAVGFPTWFWARGGTGSESVTRGWPGCGWRWRSGRSR